MTFTTVFKKYFSKSKSLKEKKSGYIYPFETTFDHSVYSISFIKEQSKLGQEFIKGFSYVYYPYQKGRVFTTENEDTCVINPLEIDVNTRCDVYIKIVNLENSMNYNKLTEKDIKYSSNGIRSILDKDLVESYTLAPNKNLSFNTIRKIRIFQDLYKNRLLCFNRIKTSSPLEFCVSNTDISIKELVIQPKINPRIQDDYSVEVNFLTTCMIDKLDITSATGRILFKGNFFISEFIGDYKKVRFSSLVIGTIEGKPIQDYFNQFENPAKNKKFYIKTSFHVDRQIEMLEGIVTGNIFEADYIVKDSPDKIEEIGKALLRIPESNILDPADIDFWFTIWREN